MAIGCEFLIKTAWHARRQETQLKLPDDTGQAEVKMLRHQRGNGVIWDGARAKGLHVHTDRTGLTDRVAQLHFTLVRQARHDDILRGVPGGIGANAIDTCRVFATERRAAVARVFAIGINGVLSPSESGMYRGPTHEQDAIRIDENLRLGIGLQGLIPDPTLENLLRRPEMTYQSVLDLATLESCSDPAVCEQVEIQVKYEGYIHRQFREVHNFKKLESMKIPADFEYSSVNGFSTEVLEKLKRFSPHSLGQASRIEGVTPAAVSLLQVAVARFKRA